MASASSRDPTSTLRVIYGFSIQYADTWIRLGAGRALDVR